MREEIGRRFELNIARAKTLRGLYKSHRKTAQGRKDVSSLDILRAAVVFLHATLEEVLRGVIIWRLPYAAPEVLDAVPLVGLSTTGRPEKFFLGRLASHRGTLVEDVLEQSVEEYANSFSFNRTSDISRVLEQLGIPVAKVNQDFANIEALMKRRHHIVHQADKNPKSGPGQHDAQSIGEDTVRAWEQAIRRFVAAVFAELPA